MWPFKKTLEIDSLQKKKEQSRLCKDCDYYLHVTPSHFQAYSDSNKTHHLCTRLRKTVSTTNLVVGTTYTETGEFLDCLTERSKKGGCQESGIFWELYRYWKVDTCR